MKSISVKNSVFIVFLGFMLCSATAMSATMAELEQRLGTLEEEIKISQEEAADLSGRLKNSIAVSGYADVEYVSTDDAGTIGGFRMHHLSLMLKKQVSENLKFFSEIEFEDGVWMDGGDGANALLLEAVNFDYSLNHSTTLRVGRFFTPAGIWSVDHYPPFVSTQDRPQHIRLIFPQLTDGVSVTGNHGVGDAFFNYNLYVANGETSNFNGKQDSNHNLAAGLRVNMSLPAADVFDVGATYYQENMTDPAGDFSLGTNLDPASEKKAYGIHAKIRQGSFGFQAEYADGAYTPTQIVVGSTTVDPKFHRKGVGARLKLTTCAGLKLTRCYSGVDYYAAVDKSTRL